MKEIKCCFSASYIIQHRLIKTWVGGLLVGVWHLVMYRNEGYKSIIFFFSLSLSLSGCMTFCVCLYVCLHQDPLMIMDPDLHVLDVSLCAYARVSLQYVDHYLRVY